ncbi:MAG: 30S ribosomal protein S5 [Candidatus Pacebacteria bacterium]|nr:30S ribosomal protein S5 [Candidatus Paceibacterota bacterium]MDD3808246.1 30S ribosomal protein S5 [Candidatus Paceibacterota bacterium]
MKTNDNIKTNDNTKKDIKKDSFGPKKPFERNRREGGRRPSSSSNFVKKTTDFDQLIADIRRVTRVTAGGKHMSFSVTMLLGNNKGKIAIGTAKGVDVPKAIDKAKKEAMKNIVTVPIINDTVPFKTEGKFCASRILIKPAKEGKGVIAGGVVRNIMILAGIKNVTCKILSGSHSAINNGKATIEGLKQIARIYNLENEKNNIKVEAKTTEDEEK